jgi:mannose-6-phosphate isomerase-like protein (cupin superfamily)
MGLDEELRAPGEAPPLVRILASGAETGRAFSLVEYILPPYSAGVALHSHGDYLEGCYMLEGLLALTCGDETLMLAPGEVQLISPGAGHTCWNPTPVPARLLLIFAPGCGEEDLRRLALAGLGDAPGAG